MKTKKSKTLTVMAIVLSIVGIAGAGIQVLENITCKDCLLDNPTFTNFSGLNNTTNYYNNSTYNNYTTLFNSTYDNTTNMVNSNLLAWNNTYNASYITKNSSSGLSGIFSSSKSYIDYGSNYLNLSNNYSTGYTAYLRLGSNILMKSTRVIGGLGTYSNEFDIYAYPPQYSTYVSYTPISGIPHNSSIYQDRYFIAVSIDDKEQLNIEDNKFTLPNLNGSGNAYACLDSNGKLYRNATACV